jgi:hypothetical protein
MLLCCNPREFEPQQSESFKVIATSSQRIAPFYTHRSVAHRQVTS